jgi:hypothetical protein
MQNVDIFRTTVVLLLFYMNDSYISNISINLLCWLLSTQCNATEGTYKNGLLGYQFSSKFWFIVPNSHVYQVLLYKFGLYSMLL